MRCIILAAWETVKSSLFVFVLFLILPWYVINDQNVLREYNRCGLSWMTDNTVPCFVLFISTYSSISRLALDFYSSSFDNPIPSDCIVLSQHLPKYPYISYSTNSTLSLQDRMSFSSFCTVIAWYPHSSYFSLHVGQCFVSSMFISSATSGSPWSKKLYCYLIYMLFQRGR